MALVVLLSRSFDMIDLVVLPLPGPACLNEDARMLRNNMSLKRPMSNAPGGAAARGSEQISEIRNDGGGCEH